MKIPHSPEVSSDEPDRARQVLGWRLDGGHPGPGIQETLAVFAVVAAVYILVSPHPHGFYHHYVLMAKAFLAGRVDLIDVPSYYHDLIHYRGKVFAPFQPLPAVLMIPLVAILGDNFHPGRLGQVLAALAVAVFVSALGRLGLPRAVRVFVGLALGLGSVFWSAAAIGSTWFFAHVVTTLMLALMIRELAGPARGWAVGAFLAGAFLTRATLLPAIPGAAALLAFRRGTPRPLLGFALAVLAGVGALAAYNALRFGNPLQSGYGMLALAAPSAQTVQQSGMFGWQYLPQHLYTILFRAPELIDRWPFLKPNPAGMAIVFTSPVILRLLFDGVGARRWLAWGAPIALVLGPTLLFFSTGWVQFGYRYSLDWWPFALVLLAFALHERPSRLDYALLAASVAMNALGTYWVRALGW